MQLTRIQAIKQYFEQPFPDGRTSTKLDIKEMKALTEDDKKELGELCAKALGAELIQQGV